MIKNAINAMSTIAPLTVSMDEIEFVPLICMLLEEWCRVHHRDITEFVPMINILVHEVNEELGPYVY